MENCFNGYKNNGTESLGVVKLEEKLGLYQVCKSYKTPIIQNFSLSAKEGEIIGLIGENGVGETTLMKLILGLSFVDSGQILLNHVPLDKRKALTEKVAGLIEQPCLYYKMSGRDNLSIYQSFYNEVDLDWTKYLLKVMNMEQALSMKVKAYSLGMKQKLGLIMALSVKPSIVVLDEPFNSLDPVSVAVVRKELKEYAVTNHAVVLISSHILPEIENMCDTYVFMLHHGKYKMLTHEEIKQQQEKQIQYYLNLSASNQKVIRLMNECGIEYTPCESGIKFEGQREKLYSVLQWIEREGYDIIELSKSKRTLEDIFFDFRGEV